MRKRGGRRLENYHITVALKTIRPPLKMISHSVRKKEKELEAEKELIKKGKEDAKVTRKNIDVNQEKNVNQEKKEDEREKDNHNVQFIQ